MLIKFVSLKWNWTPGTQGSGLVTAVPFEQAGESAEKAHKADQRSEKPVT